MRQIETEIHIEAPPPAVWSVLVDFAAYPDWNPFIRRLRGEAKVGARLEVTVQPPGGSAMTFKPTVLLAEPNRELRWVGRVVMRGLFDGEHRFRLEPASSGCLFHHSEAFAGVLVPMFAGTLARTRRGFDDMNEALKRRVEAKAPAT